MAHQNQLNGYFIIKYYQPLMSPLNHLLVYTCSNITFTNSKLVQFNSAPTATHLNAAMHIVRYLKGTYNLCLIYKWQSGIINIVGYSNGDWRSDLNDRISYMGFAFMVHSGPAA